MGPSNRNSLCVLIINRRCEVVTPAEMRNGLELLAMNIEQCWSEEGLVALSLNNADSVSMSSIDGFDCDSNIPWKNYSFSSN